MTNHKVQEEPVLRVTYFAFHHICLLFGFLFSLPDPPWGALTRRYTSYRSYYDSP